MAAGQIVVFPPITSFQTIIPTIGQLKQGLAVVDPAGLVKYHLPDDPTNNVTIGWFEDLFPNSGALYGFIASQLGYTPDQMTAFYQSLATYPARP